MNIISRGRQRVNPRLWAYRRKGRLRGLEFSLRRQASRPTAHRRGFQPLALLASPAHVSCVTTTTAGVWPCISTVSMGVPI
jgi:hypothetical protein